jgi:hypothetical protein
MKFIAIIFLLFSTNSFANAYLGGSYGYSTFSSDALETYKAMPKGNAFGGFFGVGKSFVGLEGIFQKFSTQSDIKHDGGTYQINENATAMGGALRFSFTYLYLRMGVARYKLDQSVDIEDTATRTTAEEIYEVQEKGTTKNGALYGLGTHMKVGSARLFLDYTRYQITSVGHYDTVSFGLSFVISDRFFSTEDR